jgi:hypothetical protein
MATKSETVKKSISNQDVLDKITGLEGTLIQSNEDIEVTLQALIEKVSELTERLEEQKKKAGSVSNTFQLNRRLRIVAQDNGFIGIKHEDELWNLKGRQSEKLFSLFVEFADPDNGRFSKTGMLGYLKQYGVLAEEKKEAEEAV